MSDMRSHQCSRPVRPSARRVPVLLWGSLALMAALSGCTPQPGAARAGPSRAQATVRALPAPARPPRGASDYPWPAKAARYESLLERFPAPAGHRRVEVGPGSWAEWVRCLPLKPRGAAVRAADGTVVVPGSDPRLAAVVDIDVLKNQECADTIWRLQAEYLWSCGRPDRFSVPTAGGGELGWNQWTKGMRPYPSGGRIRLRVSARPGASRSSYVRLMESVFAWCGTYCLWEQTRSVTPGAVRVGDVFVHSGSPGHAVLIADLARGPEGRLKALLLEGYMPAQSAHVMAPRKGDAWFELDPSGEVATPFWGAFDWSELRRLE